MREYSRDEKSLILFFETRLVDFSGRVASVHMNSEDMNIAKKLTDEGLISFGRLTMSTIDKYRGNPLTRCHTHWVRFSDEAWKLAHKWRRERSDRMLSREKEKLDSEMTCNK